MIIVASIILGAVFVVSGVAKVAAPAQWRAQAADLGVPAPVATVVPFVEIAVGALLVAQLANVRGDGCRGAAGRVHGVAGRSPGAGSSAAVRLLRHVDDKPIGSGNVIRNVVFLALAGVVAFG